MSNKLCVVCNEPGDWKSTKKGQYPLLCDKCLMALPNPAEKLDSYKYVG